MKLRSIRNRRQSRLSEDNTSAASALSGATVNGPGKLTGSQPIQPDPSAVVQIGASQPVEGVAAPESTTEINLEEALDIALAQHPALREGQATVEAAQHRVWQEWTGYLPRGAYTYQYTRQQIPITTAVGGIEVEGTGQTRTTSQRFGFHSTDFSMTQLLFDFGQTLDAVRSAASTLKAKNYDLETTRQTIIFNTTQAYYGLLSAERVQHVAEETVQQNQQLLREAQARFRVGLAPRFDVTQSRVQVSNAELDLVSADNNVDLARETLRTAMGSPGPFSFTLLDTLDWTPVAFDQAVLLADAYANRSEIRSIQAQHEAATKQVSALQKKYLPSVLGGAQYNWTGRDHPLQDGWLLGVTFTVPLFDDILTTTQVREAQAEVRRLQARIEDLRLQVALEVRQSMLNVQRAEKSIRVSEQVLAQAQENLELAQGRYSAGVGHIIEVTDSQLSLISARARHIQALYTAKTAVAELERAIGQQLE